MASAFGAWLKQNREARGWSGERLAEEIGTSQGNVSMYERGLRTPRRTTVERFAEVLNADASSALIAAGFIPTVHTAEAHISARASMIAEAKRIRYISDPDDAEMMDAYDNLPEVLQDSFRENIIRVAHEMKKSDKSRDEIGTRADADENPSEFQFSDDAPPE